MFPIRPFLFLLCLYFLACSGDQTRTLAAAVEFSDLPSRRELSRSLRQQGEVIIAYSSGSEDMLKVARQFQEMTGRISFKLLPADSIRREDLDQKVLLVLGSPTTNWLSEELNRKLPFNITGDVVSVDGKTFRDSSLVFSLPLYPSPYNQRMPIIWLSGINDEAIAQQLFQNFEQGWFPLGYSSGGYELYRNDERILLGFFKERSWSMDRSLQYDLSEARDTVIQTEHYRMLANKTQMSRTELQNIAEACETAAQAIRAFTGVEKKLPKLNLHLYPTAEEKGLRLYNTDHSNIDFSRGEVHTVFNEIYKTNLIGKENELLLRKLLNKPNLTVLERGLAVSFTEQWQIKGYSYWTQKLYQSENMPALWELLDNERFENGSELVFESLAASLVDFLVEYWGRDVFLDRYIDWSPNVEELVFLEREWYHYLERNKDFVFLERPVSEELPYLSGFNFAHEGYAIYNGYISRKATESLGKMASLGSTAAAIIPYSYMRNPESPTVIPIARRAGSENDESVINSIYATRRLGMTTVLKPHIWFGGGHWPGDVMMKNEEDWQAFFKNYHAWILHYAMLAEIHEVDLFVIGTEFAKASLAREDDWRALIRRIRKLYSGKITYAANWGNEFEKVGFWDELDYIGLDCYYPLGKSTNASYKDREVKFQSVLKKIESIQQKFDKKVLFTEIGYRSIPAPWINPHAEADGAGYNGLHQQQCYEIVMKNLEGKDEEDAYQPGVSQGEDE